jgi:5-methyltetrahydropteroyltriglutamate--homocysteine methyltransferase
MASRTAPPFRADHVGSLLRPPALLCARAARAAGTITADADRLCLSLQYDLWGS